MHLSHKRQFYLLCDSTNDQQTQLLINISADQVSSIYYTGGGFSSNLLKTCMKNAGPPKIHTLFLHVLIATPTGGDDKHCFLNLPPISLGLQGLYRILGTKVLVSVCMMDFPVTEDIA